MQSSLGKANNTIGNKYYDNKDPKNKKKVSGGASSEGMVKGSAGNTKLSPQNDMNQTPDGPDQEGDTGVQVAGGRAKKIIRKDTSYTDTAIAAAKKAKGM